MTLDQKKKGQLFSFSLSLPAVKMFIFPSSQDPSTFPPFFFLSHFQTVMRESSRLLHQSTDGRAYIKGVDVILPSSWTGDLSVTCQRNVSRTRLGSFSEADVRISSAPHPLFTGGEDFLWTQQSRDCGQVGDYISAGPEFFFRLTNNTSDVWIKSKSFPRFK